MPHLVKREKYGEKILFLFFDLKHLSFVTKVAAGPLAKYKKMEHQGWRFT
jgi:hypothetical protein